MSDSEIAALRAALKVKADVQRLTMMRNRLVQNELEERVSRGLPPYHALRLDHLFFPHSQDMLKELRSITDAEVNSELSSSKALTTNLFAKFCSGDEWTELEAVVARIRPTTDAHVWASVTFDTEVYRSIAAMSDADIVGSVPAMELALNLPENGRPIILLACDYRYFVGFCIPLLRSLAAQGEAAVHLHLMDFPPEKVSKLGDLFKSMPTLTLGVTLESPGLAKNKMARDYYHAVRFVRLYQLLHHYRRPLWLMDVDALFNRDPDAIFRRHGATDFAFRIRPGRLEPWNQFNACMVGARPTLKGISYAKLIAAFTAHASRSGQLRWGVDQFAMYACYQFMADEAPELSFLGPEDLDYSYSDHGVVWCNSGSNKFAQVQRPPGAPIPTEDAERINYIEAFDRYRTA